MTANRANYTAKLRSLMQSAGVPSYRDLSRRAGVSERQISRLRQGQADQMRAESLIRMANVLGCSLVKLVKDFSADYVLFEAASSDEWSSQEVKCLDPDSAAELAAHSSLRQEYEQLQMQLRQQKSQLTLELQRAALHTLESWLIFWPTAVATLQQQPDLPASRLVPLVRPVERLLDQWQVEAIATVGEELPYDPTQHQLIEGTAAPGQRVRVRNVGYQHHGKLLHRAKVSPL